MFGVQRICSPVALADRGNHHLGIRMPEPGYWFIKYSCKIIQQLFDVSATDYLNERKNGKNLRKTSRPKGRETTTERTQATCGIDDRLEY